MTQHHNPSRAQNRGQSQQTRFDRQRIRSIIIDGDALETQKYAQEVGNVIKDEFHDQATQTQVRALFMRLRQVQYAWNTDQRDLTAGYRQAVLLHPVVSYYTHKNKLDLYGKVLMDCLELVRGDDPKPDLPAARTRFNRCVDFMEAVVAYSYRS